MAKKPAHKSRQYRLFFLFIPVGLLLAAGIYYLSLQKSAAGASCGCGEVTAQSTGKFEDTNQAAIFNDQPVAVDFAWLKNLAQSDNQIPQVLGANLEDRWIEVNLTEQKLYAHNGNKIDYTFLVSTGKWAPTPTGEFKIWGKLRFTRMKGGSVEKHDFYDLPNVPYTQYFYQGYGLHGAYWHNNFGHPMSHGCVNLSVPDAEKLFYWTNPVVPLGQTIVMSSATNIGTKVVIHN
jgi:hypothetical protein